MSAKKDDYLPAHISILTTPYRGYAAQISALESHNRNLEKEKLKLLKEIDGINLKIKANNEKIEDLKKVANSP